MYIYIYIGNLIRLHYVQYNVTNNFTLSDKISLRSDNYFRTITQLYYRSRAGIAARILPVYRFIAHYADEGKISRA